MDQSLKMMTKREMMEKMMMVVQMLPALLKMSTKQIKTNVAICCNLLDRLCIHNLAFNLQFWLSLFPGLIIVIL